MQAVERTLVLDDEQLEAIRQPYLDLLEEEPDGPDRWVCATGPYDHYVRTIEVVPELQPNGTHRVTERVEFKLAIPIWGALFRGIVARTFRRREVVASTGDHEPKAAPWWSPPDLLDARASRMVALLATLSMVTGYLGTVISQTITFAADQFDASKSAQGATLAAARTGVLLSLLLMVIADRRGRQRLMVVCTVGGIVAAAIGALSPNLVFLGSSQFLSRSFATALTLLIAVVAAEEMPKGARAYAASVIAMTGALGAGGAVILLPLADLDPNGWRAIYLAPLLAMPFYVRIASRVPESRRFVRPHARVTMAGHRGRLALLGASTFFGVLFLAPATQFQNDFLRDDHGFSALGITIFTICTNTPAGIGIVVGGRLADLKGRRVVGAIGTFGGAVLLASAYHVSGPWLWLAWVCGSIVAAMTVPALAVYGPELFPTALRGRANGLITLTGVAGGAIGLSVAGRLGDHFDSLGPGLTMLAAGPVVVALLVLTLYPETAHMELEELNPEDAAFSTPVAL